MIVCSTLNHNTITILSLSLSLTLYLLIVGSTVFLLINGTLRRPLILVVSSLLLTSLPCRLFLVVLVFVVVAVVVVVDVKNSYGGTVWYISCIMCRSIW